MLRAKEIVLFLLKIYSALILWCIIKLMSPLVKILNPLQKVHFVEVLSIHKKLHDSCMHLSEFGDKYVPVKPL
jgi:hypothetical protein